MTAEPKIEYLMQLPSNFAFFLFASFDRGAGNGRETAGG